MPYYAEHRDLTEIDGGRLVLYRRLAGRSRPRPGDSWPMPMRRWSPRTAPTRSPPARWCSTAAALRVLLRPRQPGHPGAARRGESRRLSRRRTRLAPFDLVLSYTGGGALDRASRAPRRAARGAALRLRRSRALSARRAARTTGARHSLISAPMPPIGSRRWSGCFSSPARRRPGERFVIGGAQYPRRFPLDGRTSSSCATCRPAEHPRFLLLVAR